LKTLIILFLLASCGKSNNDNNRTVHKPSIPSPDEVVVMARASFDVTTNNASNVAKFMNLIISNAYAANPAAQPVTVVLAGTTTMTLSNANFSVPTMTNDLLNFGTLNITQLQTNDLKKCGNNGNQKCTKALFRIYTTSKPGAGFWNDEDAYGVPLLASGPLGEAEVGLNQIGAHSVQQITIANNKNTISLADFSPAPAFTIQGDFYNAGAGTYTTTINVEFALAP
jgi:hypothetical protein